MDFAEDEQDRMLRDAVFAIVVQFGHGYYVAKARAGEKTTELWGALAEHGFLGVNIPERVRRGRAGDVAAGGRVRGVRRRRLSAADAAGVARHLRLRSSAASAPSSSRTGGFPGLGTGQDKMAFAITEPDAGSNSHRISTVATPVADGYRMRGTKYYISGVDEATPHAGRGPDRNGRADRAGRSSPSSSSTPTPPGSPAR